MLVYTEKELRELKEALDASVVAGITAQEPANLIRRLIVDLLVLHDAMGKAEALADGWGEAKGAPQEKALLATCAGALWSILGSANDGQRFKPRRLPPVKDDVSRAMEGAALAIAKEKENGGE